MDDQSMTFEQMQLAYRRIKHTWQVQDDATKQGMLHQVRQIYHMLSPGERGFMTDIHDVERAIEVDLESRNAGRSFGAEGD